MSNPAASIAFDPSAPASERAGALGELQRTHMPSVGDLMPSAPILALVEQIQAQYEEQSFAKAIDPNVVPFPSRNSKAGAPGMQSVQVDDLQISVLGDYWERPGVLSFDSLRAMVEQTPILSAVVLTRTRQVQRFCQVDDSGNDAPGFSIRHVDRAHQLTAEEKAQVQQMNRFMANCGWEFSPRRRKALKRDSFKQLMAKATRDSLGLDSIGIELEWKRDKLQGIDGFYAVDGSTIRLCSETGYRGDDEIYALQVVQGRVSTGYGYDDLIYEPRNPRTDVTSCGYGQSETELLIRVVTGFLNAMSANIKGFDSNSIPRGMLHLTGGYTQQDIDAFKRQWNAMVRGVNNTWALPVMVSKDQESKASYETFGAGFDEMMFSKWMTFLTSIVCAIYGMSPAEINFDSFTGGGSSALSGSDTAEKLASSKDSGLRPLLSYFEGLWTDYLISDFGDQWVFRWTGLDPEDADKKHEIRKLVLTVDEVRAEEGHQKHPDPVLGGAPLNASLVGLYTQAQQAKQQAQQQDFGGDAGAGGQPGAGGPPGADGGPAGGAGDFGADAVGDFGQDQPDGHGGVASRGHGELPPDFGSESGGEDFGKSMPLVFEVSL